ncbi:hypothetical protein [Microbacterium sp. LWO13-1.2]|uniref:hypothetical protein n=1 Tax=Microbacterium sp. LWO13-1.2 TaxID=3135262 RepID=UPI003139BD6D
MPRNITISEGRELLLTRAQLRESGRSEREIRMLVATSGLVRVRRGWYVDGEAWRDLWNEGRHLLQVIATHLSSDLPGPVFMLSSAGVLRGLPLYRLAPKHVHVALGGASHSKTRFGVVHHDVQLARRDVDEVEGIRCTSLDRTVLDLACTMSEEAAVSCADAALRRLAVVGHVQNEDLADEWRLALGERADQVSVRGIRRARRVIEFADGRAQLPGESVSRLQLHRLGFRSVPLQTRVVGPNGEDYWLDFAFPSARRFGEFDGKRKYFDADLRGGRSVGEAVLDEKYREDAVRGVTGWGFARWGSEHIETAEQLGRRLRAFGIRPPG